MYQAAAADPSLASATARDNVMVWDRKRSGHYEVWYLTFNHPASRTGFWLRHVIEAPDLGAPYAQVWFGYFDGRDPRKNFALHDTHPIAELHDAAAPFRIAIGASEIGHDHARGAIEGAGHSARWDLTWLPAAATHHHLPGVFYKRPLGGTTVLSPNLDVPLRGTVVVDGVTVTLDGAPGGQTHLWGKKHAHAWAWGHCNAFEGRRGATLETLSARINRRGIVTPPLTVLALYLDGETLKFTELHNLPLNRGRFGTGRYEFSARSADVRITGAFRCRPEDMVLSEYHDPDGDRLYNTFSAVADLEVKVERRSTFFARWNEQARLVAPQAGTFEVAGRSADPAIEKRHVSL
jgi:hypothetical protein